MTREVDTITVVGAGSMGHGVAELAALNGFDVRLRDIEQEVLDKAMENIRWSLDKLVEKDTVPQDQADTAYDRITATTDLQEALDGTDFVIEAVPEDLNLKQKIFADLEDATEDDVILASNTSTMRITEIAEKVQDPSRVIGMHFFNPVLLMDLIEIIRGDETSDEAVEVTTQVSETLGKTVVVCKEDVPGFITSRLVGAFTNSAIQALEQGEGSKEEIDAALKFDAGFPMGPFELADYTGLDIAHHAGNYIAERLGEAYRPPEAIDELVEAGKLGKKSGEGFYDYSEQEKPDIRPDQAGKFDAKLVLAPVANEAAKLLQQGAGSAEDIDKAMRLGAAFPKGPLAWADEVGLDVVVDTLNAIHEATGDEVVEPASALTERVDAGNLGKSTGEGFHTYDATEDAEEGLQLETVQVDVDEDTMVGTITLDRPHRMNAISGQLIDDLNTALTELDGDDRVRCILLTGTGEKAFCVGADLQESGGLEPAMGAQLARANHLVNQRIEQLDKVVVAGLNGYAFGGGLELALACDFRVAAKRAKVSQPEIKLGLIPGAGGTQRLPKLIGLSRAKEFVLLGERWSAEDAEDIGLLHRVYENDAFREEAHAFAAKLARGPPIAQRLAKQALNAAPTTEISAGMELESSAFGVLLSTEDVMEGVASMFQKKDPEFQGK